MTYTHYTYNNNMITLYSYIQVRKVRLVPTTTLGIGLSAILVLDLVIASSLTRVIDDRGLNEHPLELSGPDTFNSWVQMVPNDSMTQQFYGMQKLGELLADIILDHFDSEITDSLMSKLWADFFQFCKGTSIVPTPEAERFSRLVGAHLMKDLKPKLGPVMKQIKIEVCNNVTINRRGVGEREGRWLVIYLTPAVMTGQTKTYWIFLEMDSQIYIALEFWKWSE